MHPARQLEKLLHGPDPILALAPMQDVTDRSFLALISRYGGADLYFTEYFRVYAGSHVNRTILRSVTENPTDRPVVAQLIGNDIPELVRTARELQQHPVAGIDLNLGCPAPVVYRKCAGGGLLREPERIDAILGALRHAVQVRFTVKTRLGFDNADGFEQLLDVFARHSLDLLTVHGRTVREQYRSAVHYDAIARAALRLPYPVLANGNIASADKAVEVLRDTRVRGLMIGRGAIRNPWLFNQIRSQLRHEPIWLPTGRDVLGYVHDLVETLRPESSGDRALVARVKKHLNYLGLGVDPRGEFLHRMRRVTSEAELFETCNGWLDHGERLTLEPFDMGLPPSDVLAGVHS